MMGHIFLLLHMPSYFFYWIPGIMNFTFWKNFAKYLLVLHIFFIIIHLVKTLLWETVIWKQLNHFQVFILKFVRQDHSSIWHKENYPRLLWQGPHEYFMPHKLHFLLWIVETDIIPRPVWASDNTCSRYSCQVGFSPALDSFLICIHWWVLNT